MMMSALRSWQPASGVKSVGFIAYRVGETLHPQRAEETDKEEFGVLCLGFKCHTPPSQQFFPLLISILWSPQLCGHPLA